MVYTPPVTSTGETYDLGIDVLLDDGDETTPTIPVTSTTVSVFAGNGAVDPTKSYIMNGVKSEVAVGGLIAGGTVGTQFTFYLQLVDVNGIQFTTFPPNMPASSPYVSILNVDPDLVTVARASGADADTGKYSITISGGLQVARRYTVIVRLCVVASECPDGTGSVGFTEVKNSGVQVQMRPAAASAARAALSGAGLTAATVTVEASFTVASFDQYGNSYRDGPDGASGPLTWYSNIRGPDNYKATLTSPSPSSTTLNGFVSNNRDGTYTVTYTPTKSDPQLPSVLTVILCDAGGSACVQAAQNEVMVMHGPLSSTLTYLDGSTSLEQWKTGEDISFVVMAIDVEGNEYYSNDVVFNLELAPYPETADRGAVSITAQSYHQPAGAANRFEIVVPGSRVNVAGFYYVTVRDAEGNAITDAAANINLIAGEIDPAASRIVSATGSSSSQASATEKTVVNIIAKDSAGNVLLVSDECVNPTSGDPCPIVRVEFSVQSEYAGVVPASWTPTVTVKKAPVAGVSFQVEFFRKYPGFYYVGALFTSGGGVQLPAYGMVATPTPAPTLQACKMDDSLGLIICTFSQATNEPGTETPGSTVTECSAVLNAATVALLGRGPTCYWSNNRTFAIFTGVQPTVQVRTETSAADRITLQDNSSTLAPLSCERVYAFVILRKLFQMMLPA